MTFRLITWNMNHWQQSSASRIDAWLHLKSTISPDIALLQEFVPEGKDGEFSCVHHEFGGRMSWGTTIISFSGELKPIDFFVTHQGSITCAEYKDSESMTDVAFASIYGIIEQSRATPNMHHVISDLTPLILGDFGKKPVIIGGDFNTSLQWEEGNKKWPGLSPRILFERIEDFGLVNVTKRFFEDHVQTFRARKGDFPWQNDYLFVSKEIVEKITACEVLHDDMLQDMSDHYPILIEIEL